MLVIEHYRRLRSREYVCPAAKLEKLLSEGSHRSLWHWREEELVPLSRGERTPWHDYFGLNNR